MTAEQLLAYAGEERMEQSWQEVRIHEDRMTSAVNKWHIITLYLFYFRKKVMMLTNSVMAFFVIYRDWGI